MRGRTASPPALVSRQALPYNRSTGRTPDTGNAMHDQAAAIIAGHCREGLALREDFFLAHGEGLRMLALRAAACLARGGTLLFCGAGTDQTLARLLAAAFVHRHAMDRPALPALALGADAVLLAAVACGAGYDQALARQVEALGRPGDMLVALACEDAEQPVTQALRVARGRGLLTAGLARAGGEALALCELPVPLPAAQAPLAREVLLAAGHALCRLTDYYLFEHVAALAPWLPANGENEV